MHELLESSGFLDETLGRDHILEQEGAVERLFEEVLDPAVCIYECEQRVFAECQALEKHPLQGTAASLPRPCACEHHQQRQHVAPEAFQQLMQDPGALALDLREPEEYARGHLAGSRLLPLRRLGEEAARLPRDRALLLICRSGRRTARAVCMLEELGFTRLHGLRGGILAWRAEGLPYTCSTCD